MDPHLPGGVRVRSGGSHAHARGGDTHFHGASRGLVATLCVLCGLALGGIAFDLVSSAFQERAWERQFSTAQAAWHDQFDVQTRDYQKLERSNALLERRYIDIETYAILNHWKLPGDDQHGPLGNIERMKGDEHVRR